MVKHLKALCALFVLFLAACSDSGQQEPAGPPDWDTELESINAPIIATYRGLGDTDCAGAAGIQLECADALEAYTDVVLDAIVEIRALSDAHDNEPPADKVEHYEALLQAMSDVEDSVAGRDTECATDQNGMRCANARIHAVNRATALRWVLQNWYAPIGG